MDPIGRKGDRKPRSLLPILPCKVEIGHLVATARIRVQGIYQDRGSIAIGMSAIGDKHNVGLLDITVSEELQIGLVPIDSILRFCVTNDAAQWATGRQVSRKSLIPQLVVPGIRIPIDAAPANRDLPRELAIPKHGVLQVWTRRIQHALNSQTIENMMVVDQ